MKFAIVCTGPMFAPPEAWVDRALVEKYDPDYDRGEGRAWFINNLTKAKLFDMIEQALAYVNQVASSRPLTESGMVNGPIKCFRIEYQVVHQRRIGNMGRLL